MMPGSWWRDIRRKNNPAVIFILWLALLQSATEAPVKSLVCATGAALIIEKQSLRGINRPRALVLWMCNAEKHEDDFDPQVYTCPDQTTGHFYRGVTRISLVDPRNNQVINTVPVVSSETNRSTFDIPYKIHGGFYHVEGPLNEYGEGTPRLLWLRDYIGGGAPLQFAFFNAFNCTIVETTLFGYSKSRDRVVNYPIHLTEHDGTSVTHRDTVWLNHFMLRKALRPGYWKWQVRGQDGSTRYEVKYDRAKEAFDGKTVTVLDRDSGKSK